MQPEDAIYDYADLRHLAK